MRPRGARRLRPGLAGIAAVVLALLASTAEAAPLERASPAAAARPALRDTVLREPVWTLMARNAVSLWGGAYTTTTGETVNVFSSDVYAGDTSFNQVRADAIAQLPHGRELASLTAFFLTFEEMQFACGVEALACYSSRDQSLVALGEDAPDGTKAASLLAHEYGHHIAANRRNPPWRALDFGTKRWASTLRICPRERRDEVAPNDPFRYELDPGEGFAEAYRVYAETRAGLQPEWLGIVDDLFFPRAAALAAIDRDVRTPWTANTSLSRSGAFGASGAAQTRTFRIPTPLDGRLRVTLRPPAGATLRLSLAAGSTLLARGGAGMPTVQTTVCGQRVISVRVDRVRGAGTFRLAISRP